MAHDPLMRAAVNAAEPLSFDEAADLALVTLRDDGTPCCPTHDTGLKEGRYGLYCPAKDPNGKNGYCSLKFAE